MGGIGSLVNGSILITECLRVMISNVRPYIK